MITTFIYDIALKIAVGFIMLGIGFLGNTIYVLSYVDTENYDEIVEMYKEH